MDIERLRVDRELPAAELREIENVVDDVQQGLPAVGNDVEVFLEAGVVRLLFEQRYEPQNGVEGGADLVGHVREEILFGFGGIERLLLFLVDRIGVELEHPGEILVKKVADDGKNRVVIHPEPIGSVQNRTFEMGAEDKQLIRPDLLVLEVFDQFPHNRALADFGLSRDHPHEIIKDVRSVLVHEKIGIDGMAFQDPGTHFPPDPFAEDQSFGTAQNFPGFIQLRQIGEFHAHFLRFYGRMIL